MRENEKLITIARFESSYEADLAKMALEQENIPCYLAGIGVSVTIAYPAVTSVQVQVFESDAQRAKEILEQEQTGDDMQDPEDAE